MFIDRRHWAISSLRASDTSFTLRSSGALARDIVESYKHAAPPEQILLANSVFPSL
jgi:hypothetical protein